MLTLIALFMMGDGFIARREDPDDRAASALLRRLAGSRDPDEGTPGHRAVRPAPRPGWGPAGRADAEA